MKKEFLKILDSTQVTDKAEDLKFYGKDSLYAYKANPSLVLFPNSTQEVQAIVKLANQKNIKLVPSGGRTGYSGGATALNQEVVVSLEKFNQIYDVDLTSNTLTCEAGAITEKVMDKAEQAGLCLPIDLASKGSSQIGGNIATNAGGSRVLKYGKLRNWIKGFKAVTGIGEILDLNREVIKDQTGYDLKQLIIGSEGTLAIITEATLSLKAKSKEINRMLIACSNLKACLEVFYKFRKYFDSLSAAEYFSNDCLQEVLKKHSLKAPFQKTYSDYLLLEFEDKIDLEEDFLADIKVEDLLLSQSLAQAEEFLLYRELISETLSKYRIHKNDISVPTNSIPDFVEKLRELLKQNFNQVQIYIFGHLGDGNLHLNYALPDKFTEEDISSLDSKVLDLVLDFKGSISAEHGIGLLKKDFLKMQKTDIEIDLMKRIKAQFDPNGILNPGKIV